MNSARLAYLLECFEDIRIEHEPTDLLVLKSGGVLVVLMLDVLHALSDAEWRRFVRFLEREVLEDDGGGDLGGSA